MKHSTRAPTQYEAERIEAMMNLGCVACAVLGIPYVEVQCHHILQGNKRMGHWFTLPVCAGHHKGEFTALQQRLLVEVAEERDIKDSPLVAIHTGRKAFARVYGTEQQLWIKVQKRLRLPAVWPSSKIVPRRSHAMAQGVEGTIQGLGSGSEDPTHAGMAGRESGDSAEIVGQRGEAP